MPQTQAESTTSVLTETQTETTSQPVTSNPPTRTHPMVTQTQDGTHKITQRLNLHVSHISPVPKSPSLALSDPHWRNAMYDEYNALIKNGTWVLIPRPSGANIVWCLWLFRHKFHADGSLSRYKARLVANGSSQQLGIDCDENFSPVVKPATIRIVFSLALTKYWPIHQLDVKNTFLNCDLLETVYMHQPPGFVDPWYPHHVCRFQRDASLSEVICYGIARASTYAQLQSYSDSYADWAGCPATRRSTSGYCVFLGNNILSWSFKRQPTLSRSSVEAEYQGVANVVAET
ncbi:ribonuclease H-like domain-containing protein [Tanacetum coccineum]